MTPKIIPVWYFCEQCESWIGSTPPLLPNLWGNDKSAAMHHRATKHVITKITVNELILPQKEEK